MTSAVLHELPEPPNAVACRAAGAADGARCVFWEAGPVDHRLENMTTRSLLRYQGRLDDGRQWSAVAKTLRPVWTSPEWSVIPPPLRQQVIEDLDWLDEPRLYESPLAENMPDGLRTPELYGIERGDESITLWLEDVDDRGSWDAEQYQVAARALGRLAGGNDAASAQERFALRKRPMDRLFFGKVTHHDLRIQADDRFWKQPHVAAAAGPDHRSSVERCAARIPALLARTAELPHGVCHGDASPGNILAPLIGGLVAIDWSYGHVGAVGSDLGQLLAGRFESGEAVPGGVDMVADLILTPFCAGLADVAATIDEDDIRTAWACHLAVRSVFSALVVDHRPDLEEPALVELTSRRAAVARFGMALVESVLAGAP